MNETLINNVIEPNSNYGTNYKEIKKNIELNYMEDQILSSKKLNDVLKFHQRSTWKIGEDWDCNEVMLKWLKLIEHTDALPEYYEDKIVLNLEKNHRDTSYSHREFNESWNLSQDLLTNLLYQSFGRAEGIPTKRYPSAGGLYPVIPIFITFKPIMGEKVIQSGCYVFDPAECSLLRIKGLDDVTEKQFLKFVDKKASDFLIAYVVDMKRAVTKYGYRGYRHALIEVGLASQSFRTSILQTIEEELGDYCSSSFNDNALSKVIGVSPRLSPIVMLQWFGKKK
ncbi:hypothetical protein ACFFHH_16305 [Cytobacillus solani]|uniref:SagB/ThcOx family dehydrogenase n=1 Tax=Cytobacillus solani TaxID=1637975 RepID=UPI0011540910|nr:SagB/ThcOx family dehydrogenase [Cytobacillus solani]